MKPQIVLALTTLIFAAVGCKKATVETKAGAIDSAVVEQQAASSVDTSLPAESTPATADSTGFVPKGYALFQTIDGDLNKDGVDDRVLIVKATDKSGIVPKHEGETEMVDRNRRGIIILLNKSGKYELALQNLSCFSSENEDGGVYFAPELSVEIRKNVLHIDYSHGRYGSWGYIFRFQNGDFELIGYDRTESNGPVVDRSVSINFSTGKRVENVNTNKNAESGDEVFKETVSKISVSERVKLSKIEDFDNLDVDN